LLASPIYHEYPRHVAKQAAHTATVKAIKVVAERDFAGDHEKAAEWLKAKVTRYANSSQGRRPDRNLIPHLATWMNSARYDDDESEWNYVAGIGSPDAPDAGELRGHVSLPLSERVTQGGARV
jgi:hypothetical protein